MPLRRLSNELIRLRRDELKTPVLVLPTWISLRADFYKELAEVIHSQTGQGVRFDAFRPLGGLWQTLANKIEDWQTRRINQQMNGKGQTQPMAEVVLTGNIARPSSTSAVFVIGIAQDTATLPPWTTPVQLVGSPIAGIVGV